MNSTKRFDGTPSRKKFKGYNFYIQCNDKLSRVNREELLRTSPKYLGEVSSSLSLTMDEQIRRGMIQELDSTLTDWELLEIWNPMYENFGYLMSDFKDEWEKEKVKSFKEDSFKQSLEFEELKDRISKIESKLSLMKLKSSNRVNF